MPDAPVEGSRDFVNKPLLGDFWIAGCWNAGRNTAHGAFPYDLRGSEEGGCTGWWWTRRIFPGSYFSGCVGAAGSTFFVELPRLGWNRYGYTTNERKR
jgi:hypothetical protein